MNKKYSEVRVTDDYSIFKFNKLNREVKQSKVNSLKSSIQRTGGNVVSILVDAKNHIIDGQHRFMACKELGLPVKYMYHDGTLTADDLIDINNTSNKWDLNDYAVMFSKQGNPNYAIFMKYRQQYPDLSAGLIAAILENKYTLNNTAAGSLRKRGFQRGELVIMNEPKSKILFNRLKQISTFYDGYNKRSFVYAVIHLSNQPGFDWDKFISKLKIRYPSLFDFPKAADFVKVLIDIYNYRERTKVKFSETI